MQKLNHQKIPFVCLNIPEKSFLLNLKDKEKTIEQIENEKPIKIENSLLKNIELKYYNPLSYYIEFFPFYFIYDKRKLDPKSRISINIIYKDDYENFFKFYINVNIYDTTLQLAQKLRDKIKPRRFNCMYILKKESSEENENKFIKFEKRLILKNYNIKNNSKILIYLERIYEKLYYGRSKENKFLDITKGKFYKYNLSKNPPKWQKRKPGLNILGICKNKKCKAFKKNISCSLGIGVFDLIKDLQRIRCVMCNNIFKAENFGFLNTENLYYLICGVKIRKDNVRERYQQKKWNKIEDEFFYVWILILMRKKGLNLEEEEMGIVFGKV